MKSEEQILPKYPFLRSNKKCPPLKELNNPRKEKYETQKAGDSRRKEEKEIPWIMVEKCLHENSRQPGLEILKEGLQKD